MPTNTTNSTSLLDALRAGKSADDLVREFQSQLDAAKATFDQERNDTLEELKEYEKNLIDAFMNYFNVLTHYLGVIMDDQDEKELRDLIVDLLEKMRKLKDFTNIDSNLIWKILGEF